MCVCVDSIHTHTQTVVEGERGKGTESERGGESEWPLYLHLLECTAMNSLLMDPESGAQDSNIM